MAENQLRDFGVGQFESDRIISWYWRTSPTWAPQSSQAAFNSYARELHVLLSAISRHHLKRTKAKLLCPNGHGIQRVVDAFSTQTKLACGCRRPVEQGLKERITKLEREVERARQEDAA